MKKNFKYLFVISFFVLLAVVFGAYGSDAETKSDNQDVVMTDVDGSKLPRGVKYKAFVHYPAKGKPPIIRPSCTETNTSSSHFEPVGWALKGSKFYNINRATVPTHLLSYIDEVMENSWQAWRKADSMAYVAKGDDTSVSRANYDGTNLVAWGRVPNGAIAVTYTWYYSGTGEQLESDLIFSNKLKWSYTPYTGDNDCAGISGTYDVQDIATHELGHWVGLDDLYGDADKDLTMYGYGFTAELKKATLGDGDVLGAAAIIP